MSKIWMINLALVAAVLFVYGGLNWFDNRDPEVVVVATTDTTSSQTSSEQGVSFFSKVKSWFNNSASSNKVEYVRSEDGTMLPLIEPRYDEDTLTGESKNTKARLKELDYQISVGRKKLDALFKEYNEKPNDLIREEFEYTKEEIEILKDEQAELLDRSSRSTSSGL